MEECKDKRKRVSGGDSESDSLESKVPRVDSDSGGDSSGSRLSRVDSFESYLSRVDSGESGFNSDDSAPDSVSARDIQGDLLSILEDTDNVPERDSAMQGLDSVIKSFEEEILTAGSDPGQNEEPVSGELPSNLGYLLEASDDELGLPPSTATEPESSDPGRVDQEKVDLTGFMGFEDDFPNYDTFGFGTGFTAEPGSDGGFATADGLFEYGEPADFLWRSESLQAM